MWTLIDRLKQLLFFKLATIYLRYMIGFAFVFASFIKMQGERFTTLSTENPVGFFFEAMYQTGFYWRFLGFAQFLAGSLLVTQRFATVGALIFLPIILNVCLITHSVDFGSGTPVITTLMLLGTVYLVLWDYKKWIILFQKDNKIKLDLTNEPEDVFMTQPVWTITGILFVLLSAWPWATKSHNLAIWMAVMIVTGLVAFVIGMYRGWILPRKKIKRKTLTVN